MNSVQIHETDSRYLKLPSIINFHYCPVPQVINLMKNANSWLELRRKYCFVCKVQIQSQCDHKEVSQIL